MVAWERESRIDRALWGYNIFRFTPGGNTSSESLASLCFFHRRLIEGRLSAWSCLPHFQGLAPKTFCSHCLLLTDCSLLGVENFHHYIFFGYLHNSSNAIHVAFTLCPLFTLRHSCTSCFEIHKLTSLSKVNM